MKKHREGNYIRILESHRRKMGKETPTSEIPKPVQEIFVWITEIKNPCPSFAHIQPRYLRQRPSCGNEQRNHAEWSQGILSRVLKRPHSRLRSRCRLSRPEAHHGNRHALKIGGIILKSLFGKR